MPRPLFSATLLAAALTLATPAVAYDDPESARAESAQLLGMMALNGKGFLMLSGDEDDMIAGAKTAVRQKLRDPDSAQFRNIRIVEHTAGKLVCGEVNARNVFGGYVGFQLFASSGQSARILFTDLDPAIEAALNAPLMEACGD
ncbi:hypothetical protein [uncultured Rhodospira sp.]|uniref:hypothetical protein n=1 Tax=uncultured Rhodospira sp. TaxID=1936189 RepID=UPI0026156795|nr:hypothetical protein [uncultured Rhodospira sp.]